MLAISVWLALRDAVAGIADHRLLPKLDAPATPEAILTAIEDIRVRDQATRSKPASA
jgi:xanthine dehydrogenase large subunit